ncbi:hypothetical protein SGPA1_90057 [Streptomyces misionensis JCM 4497]
MDGRPPRRPLAHRARHARRGDRRRPGARTGQGGRRQVRPEAAVPAEDPRRGRAPVPPGAPRPRAGQGGLRRRGAPRRPARRPRTQLQGRQPQARTDLRPHRVRRPVRFPAPGAGRRPARRARRRLPQAVRRPAARPPRGRGPARGPHRDPHRGPRGDGPHGRRGRGRLRPPGRRPRPLRPTRPPLPRRPGRPRGHAAQPRPTPARRSPVPRRRCPARLPQRPRRGDHGQLGQRAALRADPETRRRARTPARGPLRGERPGCAAARGRPGRRGGLRDADRRVPALPPRPARGRHRPRPHPRHPADPALHGRRRPRRRARTGPRALGVRPGRREGRDLGRGHGLPRHRGRMNGRMTGPVET